MASFRAVDRRALKYRAITTVEGPYFQYSNGKESALNYPLRCLAWEQTQIEIEKSTIGRFLFDAVDAEFLNGGFCFVLGRGKGRQS